MFTQVGKNKAFLIFLNNLPLIKQQEKYKQVKQSQRKNFNWNKGKFCNFLKYPPKKNKKLIKYYK